MLLHQCNNLFLPPSYTFRKTMFDARLATAHMPDTEHALWSRSMLFTLLTRAGRLSDLWLCGFDAGVVRALLLGRTAWYAAADRWLGAADMLAVADRAPVPRSLDDFRTEFVSLCKRRAFCSFNCSRA